MSSNEEEIVGDNEQKHVLKALSKNVISSVPLNTEAADCDDRVKDKQTKIDKIGKEIKGNTKKRKREIEHRDEGFLRPPKFFTHCLKYKPNRALAITTDTYLSKSDVYLIKNVILSKIDEIISNNFCPLFYNSSYFNGYFLLLCRNKFSKIWLMDNFKGNKNVLKGKTLVVLNATELPITFYYKNSDCKNEQVLLKRPKFDNPDHSKSEDSFSLDSGDTLKNVETVTHCKAEPFSKETTNFISVEFFGKKVQIPCHLTIEPSFSGFEEMANFINFEFLGKKVQIPCYPNVEPTPSCCEETNNFLNVEFCGKKVQIPCHFNAEPTYNEETPKFIKDDSSDSIEPLCINLCEDDKNNDVKQETLQGSTVQGLGDDDECEVLLNAKRGLKLAELHKLIFEYQIKVNNLDTILFHNKGKKQRLKRKNLLKEDKELAKLSKLEILTLKSEYLQKLKHLKQSSNKLKKECKNYYKKDRLKKDKADCLASKINVAKTLDETFSFNNVSKQELRQILFNCECIIRDEAMKKLPRKKQTEIMEMCIKNLKFFKVKFRTYHTNLDDTKKMLNRLNRFKPHLKCTNWNVLSKSVDSNSVIWIFKLKPFEVEAIRKEKFIGYTGIEQGTFKILIGPDDFSECKIKENILGDVGSSSDNKGSKQASDDEMDVGNILSNSSDQEL